jgi:hypothetical protein
VVERRRHRVHGLESIFLSWLLLGKLYDLVLSLICGVAFTKKFYQKK